MFSEPVDCQWSEWTISPCSTTCGKGKRKKIRIKIVEEKDGGVCNGQDVEKEFCNFLPWEALKECIGIHICKILKLFN